MPSTGPTRRCQGIDDALKALKSQSGRTEAPVVPWAMVQEKVCCECSLFPNCVFKQLSDNTN